MTHEEIVRKVLKACDDSELYGDGHWNRVEKALREALGEVMPECPFKVGEHVKWRGQERWFTRKIRKIDEPQIGNWVLYVGRDNWPINYQQVERVAQRHI